MKVSSDIFGCYQRIQEQEFYSRFMWVTEVSSQTEHIFLLFIAKKHLKQYLPFPVLDSVDSQSTYYVTPNIEVHVVY